MNFSIWKHRLKRKTRNLRLSLRSQFVLLLTAMSVVFAIMVWLELEQLHQKSLQTLATELRLQYERILKGVAGDLHEGIEALEEMWRLEGGKLPAELHGFLEEKEIVAVAEKEDTGHWVARYQSSALAAFPWQQLAEGESEKVWCPDGQKVCWIIQRIQGKKAGYGTYDLIIVQRFSVFMEELERYIGEEKTHILVLWQAQQGLSLVHATAWRESQTLFEHVAPILSGQNLYMAEVQSHPYLIQQLAFPYLLPPQMQVWLVYDAKHYEQLWQSTFIDVLLMMFLLWSVVLFLLVYLFKGIIGHIEALRDGLRAAEQGDFEQATQKLRRTRRPLILDELHDLRHHARHVLRHTGVVTEKMRWMAFHDPLTKLKNRRSFYQAFNELLKNCQGALAFVDLNRFKQINDVHGHETGDLVLIEMAGMLQREAESLNAQVFRLAGDEFTLLFPKVTSEAELRSYLKQLAQELNFQVQVASGETLFFSASVGGVLLGEQYCAQDKLLHWADIAMYRAKQKPERWHIFNPLQDDDALQHQQELKLLAELKHAIAVSEKDSGLFLVAQPIASCSGAHKVQRYEILLRYCNEQGELVSPATFIPIAEKYNLIFELDRWVLTHALAVLSRCDDCVQFSINLSAPTMQRENLPQMIREALDEAGVQPQRLILELTETAYVDNLVQVKQNLQALTEMGVSVALDDFGVGFSSFSYLSELPLSYVKLDGSYIRDLNDNPVHRAVVQGLSQIVHAFNMRIVAEFVETEEVMQLVRTLNADYAQGWHIGKPQPVETLIQR